MELRKKLNCVMLIDDDEPTNFLQQKVIRAANCTDNIRVFDEPEDALRYLITSLDGTGNEEFHKKPDLIFLDINMPRISGWEFIEEYSKHPESQKDGVVIMMLTTSLNPDDQAKANDIHEIAGFYTKPLTDKMLDAILLKYFADRV